MGSLNTPNPWAPYDSFKDCSQAICSIYCPQWCYIIFPPPPFDPPNNNSGRHGTPLSPLIISVIAILASAFLLLTYYIMVSRYCRGRRVDRNPELGMNLDQITQQEQQWQLAATGLDESVIESITVWKYKQGEGLVQGNDCAVCLSEFEDGENLRLLPKCSHAFHLLCIDTWLKSHSNCPLCRANIVSANPPLPFLPAPIPETHSNAPSLEIPRLNDLIFVIDDDDREIHLREEEEDEEVVSLAADDNDVSPNNNRIGQSGEEEEDEDEQKLRRSISLGSFPCQRQLLLADKLRINENKNGLKDQNYGISIEIGSSIGEQSKSQSNRCTNLELISNPAAIKRSISTGRFAVTRHNRGKNSLFPN